MDEDLGQQVRIRLGHHERRRNGVGAVVLGAGDITRLAGRSGLVDSRGRIQPVGMMALQEGGERLHVGQLTVQGVE